MRSLALGANFNLLIGTAAVDPVSMTGRTSAISARRAGRYRLTRARLAG